MGLSYSRPSLPIVRPGSRGRFRRNLPCHSSGVPVSDPPAQSHRLLPFWNLKFQTKLQIALAEIERALERGVPKGVVLPMRVTAMTRSFAAASRN